MPKPHSVLALTLLFVLGAGGTSPTRSQPATPEATDPLYETVLGLDSVVFAAFNACAATEELQRHAEFFAEDVEFYHDTGGVTWTRAEMIANTEKYVCGHFRRERVPGTFRVYPIKDFGAIAQGVHRFCQFQSGACEGEAEFLIVWRQQGDKWSITRVLSFGHRPTKPSTQPATSVTATKRTAVLPSS